MNDLPSISDYSQSSIAKAVRNTGLFHTLTLYPAAIGAGSVFLGLLFSQTWFWVAVGGVAVVVFDGLSLGLTAEQSTNLIIVLGSWVVGDSIRKTDV